MPLSSEKQSQSRQEDRLLQILEKIPDEQTREDILLIVHNEMLEHPQVYIHVTDDAGKMLFLNRSIKGFKAEELIGKNVNEGDWKVDKQDMERFYRIFGDVLKGNTVTHDYTITDKNGMKRTFKGTIKPIIKDGKVVYSISISYEITHQQEVEKLKKTKQLYEEGIKDTFVMRVLYPSGVCEYVSPSFRNVTGYEMKEGMDSNSLFFSKLHPDFHEEQMEIQKKLLNGEVPSTTIYQLKTKTKGYRWFRQTNSGVYDENGNLIAFDCITRDITEQKVLEGKYEGLDEKFNRILKEGKVALCTVKYDTKPPSLFFSESIENILGYDAKDFFDDPELWIKVAHAKDFSKFVEQYNLQLKTGDKINLTGRFIRKDGFICKLKIWGKIFRDSEGKPLRTECIFMDISDKDVYDELLDYFAQKLAEDELKKKSNEQTYIR